MSGNYPDGVTGNEYEIAGPDYESEEDREVECRNRDECDFIDTLTVLVYGFEGKRWTRWTCPECATENEDEWDADESDDNEDDRFDTIREMNDYYGNYEE